jgi:hypothetical protein
MSVNYLKEIYANERLKLFVNFSGIDESDSTNKENIKLNIYAVQLRNNKHFFSAVLDYRQIKELFDHLNSVSLFSKELANDDIRFIEADSNIQNIVNLFKKVDSTLLKLIFDKVQENEKLQLVLEALTESEIQNLHASIRQSRHQKAIANLKDLLELEENTNITEAIKSKPNLVEYDANQSEKIFQNWIEKNIWTLGIDYIKKHSARQIGINSVADLLMETTDGFIDLIELKRPKFELFSYDNSHSSYYPSKELSKVIGQCLSYLKVLEDYKLILEKQYKFKVLRPRIKVIVGRSNLFNDAQFETLRMLNSSLNHIQIITYDYLFQCGETIISYYNQKLEKVITKGADEILPTIS